MSELEKSVDFWVEELTKDTDPELFGFTDESLYYNYITRNKRNYGRWMWDCGYNAGLVNLQTKVNTYCVPQWISVKDKLPEGCETVLICNANKKFVASGYYSPVEKRWNQIGNRFLPFIITHWMPLPEPPESEDDEE